MKKANFALWLNLILQFRTMKKSLLIGLIFAWILLMSSCDYDDSNDIDIIIPNDTTQTG